MPDNSARMPSASLVAQAQQEVQQCLNATCDELAKRWDSHLQHFDDHFELARQLLQHNREDQQCIRQHIEQLSRHLLHDAPCAGPTGTSTTSDISGLQTVYGTALLPSPRVRVHEPQPPDARSADPGSSMPSCFLLPGQPPDDVLPNHPDGFWMPSEPQTPNTPWMPKGPETQSRLELSIMPQPPARVSFASSPEGVENHRREWLQHKRSRAEEFIEENEEMTKSHSRVVYRADRCQRFLLLMVEHTFFQSFSAAVIVSTAVFEGYVTHVSIVHALTSPERDRHGWFMPIATLLTVLFGIEVICQLCAYRKFFFTGSDKYWHMFDALLLLSSPFEYVQDDVGIGSLYFLRGISLLRVLRVIRVLRLFRTLRSMICMIAQSLWSLFWALLLCYLLMYLFALFFMQGAAIYLHKHGTDGVDPALTDEVLNLFGNIWNAMYTMLGSVTGGIDWIQVAICLELFSPAYKGLFALYVFFMILGALNVLTAFFVERAREINGMDKDLVIQSELSRNENFLKVMTRIFKEADLDESSTLGWAEFRDYLQDPMVKAYLGAQQLDTFDARTLFDVLKPEGDDEMALVDFIAGCQHIKGQARNVELIAVLQETRSINKNLQNLVHFASQSGSVELREAE